MLCFRVGVNYFSSAEKLLCMRKLYLLVIFEGRGNNGEDRLWELRRLWREVRGLNVGWGDGEGLQMWYIKGIGLNSYKIKGKGGSYLRVGGRFW